MNALRSAVARSVRRRRSLIPLVAAVAVCLGPSALAAQYKTTTTSVATKDFTLSGIAAWSAAKTNGFTFRPLTYGSGQSVTRPYDGVNTRLRHTYYNKFRLRTTETVAQVVGGNPSVSKSGQTVTFEMFGGKTLAPGWTVQSVQLAGGYVWDRRPQVGTQDMSFRIKVTGVGSVTIRGVTLRGPSGANAADAFVGRTSHTITGIVAWGTARQYGFEFRPLKTADRRDQIDGPPDGVRIMIKRAIRNYNVFVPDYCPNSRLDASYCMIAQVTGGNPLVAVLSHNQTVHFRMFDKMRLAPGWIVKSVDMPGVTWIRRPAAGSDDLSFEIALTSYPSRAASANVRSVVLEGPSTANNWQDAFKYAKAP